MGHGNGGSADGEARFASELSQLLSSSGLATTRQAALLRATAEALAGSHAQPRCAFVPFVPGRRSTDEDDHPGLGSSDNAALVTGDGRDDNVACLLFELEGLPVADVAIHVAISTQSPDSLDRLEPVPGWERRTLDVDASSDGVRHRLEIHPEVDFASLDLGFDTGFLRRVQVDLTVTLAGAAIAGHRTSLDVCDVRNLGTLYRRVIDRLVVPDAQRQARGVGSTDVDASYHPWYPVLMIGVDKAALYTDALVDDIVHKERNLSDPAWLLRVGIYLELLTCLGIVEGVREDVGDLLSPEERATFESSDVYREVRRRIDPNAWRRVWELRQISFARFGVPRTGPVSSQNLLQKRRATLEFLHAHHDDLKHAIELAGPNAMSAQETWQRVFRDAERAVLRQTARVFPELAFLPRAVRDLVLWQRVAVGTQEGLFPTACNQYRASMNAVARWARARGLMDYAGDECVPPQVSLLEAIDEPAQVALLQRRDGYSPRLDVTEPIDAVEPTIDEIEALLARVPILQLLSSDEVHSLAIAARPLLFGPAERLVVQGQAGDSLFLVADGTVEVLLRRANGIDVVVDTMGRGEVVGEMALLTGERRAATVRALDSVVVYELGCRHYEALLRKHPEWLDQLAEIAADRLARRQRFLTEYDAETRDESIRDRIFRRWFRVLDEP